MNPLLFPEYIERVDIQSDIQDSINKIKEDKKSRFFLLYGKGGSGKTVLQRNLNKFIKQDDIKWLLPIDLDDSQFWSLINLKLHIADMLDGKEQDNFRAYRELLNDYVKYEDYESNRESTRDQDIDLTDYKRQLDQKYKQAYEHLLDATHKIIVIQLDTVEAVRDFDVFADIINWLKYLPSTFILISGRPPLNRKDRLEAYLSYNPTAFFEQQVLETFTVSESRSYLKDSAIASGLDEDKIKKIVFLTQRHPLWLALSVYYLEKIGLPRLLTFYSLDELQSSDNQYVFDEYIGELLTPYKDRTFWHEAILRLGILRQRMNFDAWKMVMDDIPFPKGISTWEDAWTEFKNLPWIRERANTRYVTLQDAFAEELAGRYIPKVDKDGRLRRDLWKKADNIFVQLVSIKQGELNEAEGQKRLLEFEILTGARTFFDSESPYLDLYLLQVAEFHYKMLVSHDDGILFFVNLSKKALGRKQRQLADLLSQEAQRFLPRQPANVLDDVERRRLDEIKVLLDKNVELLFSFLDALSEINLVLGRVRQNRSYWEQRVQEWNMQDGKFRFYLGGLIWLYTSTWRQNLQEGLEYLDKALDVVKGNQELSGHLPKIYQLFGFTYRANQQLKEAENYLQKAILESRKEHNLEILASSLNILAYIYATVGSDQKAGAMIRQAIEIRQRLLSRETVDTPEYRTKNKDLAWSYNTLGEINRYRGKLAVAQTFYLKAERIFNKEDDHEGQAIALQAVADTQRRIALAADRRSDEEQSTKYWTSAEKSISKSLEIYRMRGLERGLETAYRRYGCFLHSKPGQDHIEAEIAFRKGLDLALEKDNYLEVVENIQELVFLFAEQGKYNEFSYWRSEIFEYENKIGQWSVFPAVMKIADGCLDWSLKKYDDAVDAYLQGYTQLAQQDGYGESLYATHRDRVFKNIDEIHNQSEKVRLLLYLKQSWLDVGLDKKQPDFIELCELKLLTAELFEEN